MKKKLWSHKKYKKKFEGSYRYTTIPYSGKNERVFQLMCWNKCGGLERVLSFESWQMAKELGWVLS